MINPQSVCIITPTSHGEVVTGYCSGLLQCAGLYGGHMFVNGNSEVNYARNLCVHAFMQLPAHFEWLAFIDADIQFSRSDFGLLISDCPENDYAGELGEWIGPIGQHIRCAEYTCRPVSDALTESRRVAKLALGFSLIHKSVFDAIRELKDDNGQEQVRSFFYKGSLAYDYFPSGALGDSHWMSEDRGFFTYAALAGYKPWIETRTRLIHWGRYGAEYESGDVQVPL